MQILPFSRDDRRVRMLKRSIVAVVGIAQVLNAQGRGAAPSRPSPPPPVALAAITEADMKRDMFALAGDNFRGREAGTVDELRASMWLADQARAIGFEPAGDDGSYFQWWSMRRTRVSDASRVVIGADTLVLWKDAIVLNPITSVIENQPITWVGDAVGAALGDLTGKVVAAELIAPPTPATVTP